MDYVNGIELLRAFDQQVEYNLKNSLIVVSAGYAQFDPENDMSFSDVFRRADEQMYQRKRYLKSQGVISYPQVLNPGSMQRQRAALDQSASIGEENITIECGGVQIRAKGDVTNEKLSALIGTLRS